MQKPPIPPDETKRLMSLHSLRLLDSGPEDRFDRITRMAKRLLEVDICLVSLVDSDRQWFKSRQGLDACETPREISFCGHAIAEERLFVVEDAHSDPRFADNPLVTEDPRIRFYAGHPIHSPSGLRIGTFCVIDRMPRTLSSADEETLKDFASLVDDELASDSKINIDELTNIANRRGFKMVASHLIPLCVRNDLDVELLFFDLDDFKAINDKYGHERGDEALRFFAKLLLKSFREADVVARLGGDEFVVLMAGERLAVDRALQRMNNVANEAKQPRMSDVRWSAGRIRFDPERHKDIDDVLRDADSRMYENKTARRTSTR